MERGAGMDRVGLKRTPLYSCHVKAQARMVDFAGWEMPVQYRGIIEEHRAVRQAAGLFDLCHMGEITVTGESAREFLQWVATNDIHRLGEGGDHRSGGAQYSLLCRPSGGVVDDIIIYCRPPGFLLVVNAANIAKDLEWLREQAGRWVGGVNSGNGDLAIEDLSADTALLALQGPQAEEILKRGLGGESKSELLQDLSYFAWREFEVLGHPAVVARTGYTGEDGFEIFLSSPDAGEVWDGLVKLGGHLGLQPAGLGARDSLRLEMCYPLYGHELDDGTTPLEARLGWVVAFDKGDFLGRDALARRKRDRGGRRLAAFQMMDGAVPRPGYPVVDERGKELGKCTSGSFSPTLGRSVGLAYLETGQGGGWAVPAGEGAAYSTPGNKLSVVVRGRAFPAEVSKMPFVQPRTRRSKGL